MYEIPKIKDDEVSKWLAENIQLALVVLEGTSHSISRPRPYIVYVNPNDPRDTIALWAYGMGEFEVFVAEPEVNEEYSEPYMLLCKDSEDDYYTYGNWDTLDELKEWLRNPVSLYY